MIQHVRPKYACKHCEEGGVVKLMAERIRQSKVIHTDDTPVPVQDRHRAISASRC
ncbi:MAG: hypothetical protein IT445_14285 [Phycisphaeraceae bacterium]|nr:hypothetical protein [Phycisphaeraceae bacterium]